MAEVAVYALAIFSLAVDGPLFVFAALLVQSLSSAMIQERDSSPVDCGASPAPDIFKSPPPWFSVALARSPFCLQTAKDQLHFYIAWLSGIVWSGRSILQARAVNVLKKAKITETYRGQSLTDALESELNFLLCKRGIPLNVQLVLFHTATLDSKDKDQIFKNVARRFVRMYRRRAVFQLFFPACALVCYKGALSYMNRQTFDMGLV